MKKHFLLACVSLLPFSPVTNASDIENQTQTQAGTAAHDAPNPLGWRLFGSGALGLGSVRSENDYRKSPFGTQYQVGGLLSYQARSWLFDMGASWFDSKLHGETRQGRDVDIRTFGALIEMSPRYRINSHWQIGPSVNVVFGTDTEFGPSVNSQIGTYFVGVKGVYEFSKGKYPMRIWEEVSTDVSISGRQAFVAMLGIQLGIPLGPFKQTENPSVTSPVSRVSAISKPANELRLTLDPKEIVD